MSTPTLNTQDPALPLGKEVSYPDQYDPGLLHPISRAQGRASLPRLTDTLTGSMTGAGSSEQNLPFCGWDLWRGYELSWLDNRGLPKVGILKVWVPCDSPNIIESKSFKLYLNSLNNLRQPSVQALQALIETDVCARTGAASRVQIVTPDQFCLEHIEEPGDICLDDQQIDIDCYQPNAGLLRADAQTNISESVFSRLLKSNCPVTGQPDWASVHIQYTGKAIDHASLLRYIVSYREHEGFHEQCVEQIFCDIMQHCSPQILSVHARYTRRGGMDINPWRATPGVSEPELSRSAQQ